MNNQVFREESLNHIASADDLHEYMRVTSPRLWMILAAILALIVGFIVFASLVTIEEKVDTTAEVTYYVNEKGEEQMDDFIVLVIPDSISDAVTLGTEVRVNGLEGTISSIFQLDGSEEDRIKHGDVVLKDESAFLKKGTYDAQIILETISPIQFLFR